MRQFTKRVSGVGGGWVSIFISCVHMNSSIHKGLIRKTFSHIYTKSYKYMAGEIYSAATLVSFSVSVAMTS